MIRFAGILVSILLSVSPASASAEAPSLAVTDAISRIAPLLSDGYAKYEGGAMGASCGSAGSPAPATAVLFSLTGWGGGNGSRQFLAVLTPLPAPGDGEARPYALLGVVPIGADFDRWFDTMDASPHRVVLRGKRWAAKDSHCCPSQAIATTYEVTPHGIDEVSQPER